MDKQLLLLALVCALSHAASIAIAGRDNDGQLMCWATYRAGGNDAGVLSNCPGGLEPALGKTQHTSEDCHDKSIGNGDYERQCTRRSSVATYQSVRGIIQHLHGPDWATEMAWEAPVRSFLSYLALHGVAMPSDLTVIGDSLSMAWRDQQLMVVLVDAHEIHYASYHLFSKQRDCSEKHMLCFPYATSKMQRFTSLVPFVASFVNRVTDLNLSETLL